MGSYKYCLCFTRKFRWIEAQPPQDVCAAFEAYTDGGEGMDSGQLRRFLEDAGGGEAVDAGHVAEQIRRIRGSARQLGRMQKQPPRLSIDDFFHFLFSVDLNPPIASQVHQDMGAPMSHYFIFTGHNSYLTGNQLSSDCSDVPIIKALQKGVRVIELDIWPNSKKDNIDVLHGRTLTSPVELTKCLKSIHEYAFSTSPYPLVITLEDHLTPDLQAKVAKMVTGTFGDILYYPGSGSLEEFPSPDDLKEKIILSTKPPKEYLESKSIKDKAGESQKDSSDDEISIPWGRGSMDLDSELGSARKIGYNDDGSRDHENDGSDCSDEFRSRRYTAPEYKLLIAISAGKPKGILKDWLRVDPDKVRRLSLSEQEFAKATISHGADIIRFTQRNILRIYPKGTRIRSSNYNPLLAWMHGAQMVAFNMQGYGKWLWLMHGLFRANGGCGYVKKPDLLLKPDADGKVFDLKAIHPIEKTLKVKVYMGDGWRLDFSQTFFDAYSPPDFYTKVGIVGVPADSSMKRTKIIEDNWTPVWEEEFTFPLTMPELALLRIEVRDYDASEKDDFAGQTCLPVRELRPGIRAVPLFDRKGVKFNSVKLLMRFAFA